MAMEDKLSEYAECATIPSSVNPRQNALSLTFPSIFSVKYDFSSPESDLLSPYEVTLERESSKPFTFDVLKRQTVDLGLAPVTIVVGLGGKECREATSVAFDDAKLDLRFLFAGLRIGKTIEATKKAIDLCKSDA